MEQKTLLTVNDLAKMLNVGRMCIYQWIRGGKIPCLRLHRCVRFEPDEIIRWLKQNQKMEKTG